MSSGCDGKDSWPELVGRSGRAAARIIMKENPHVAARVLLDGTFVTLDFRCDRVWVWVDAYGKVVRVPIIG